MKIHIMGGGTFSHVRPHLSLAAPAFGGTARQIYDFIDGSRLTEEAQGQPEAYFKGSSLHLWLTRMARGGAPGFQPRSEGDWVTNEDVYLDLRKVMADPETKVIFFSVALCDYHGQMFDDSFGTHKLTPSGKDQPRLRTNTGEQVMHLSPADKIIGKIRKERKDIFLIGFKTTAGATPQEQYEAGLNLLKRTSCNLVFANDVHTRLNMVVAPELARYHETTNRWEAVKGLVDMASKRHNLHYTRTNVEDGDLVGWMSGAVPDTLRTVVDYCINRGAYKPFNNVTVGHFGYMPKRGYMYSSRRKQNYNYLDNRDLVMVQYDRGKLTAFGAKPSAGTTSQIKVLERYYPKYDCIIHGHFSMRPESKVRVRSQYEFECGSRECGQNTVDGMTDFGGVAAVMLDKHGPNILFHRNTKPEVVIDFIEENFLLDCPTDSFEPAVTPA